MKNAVDFICETLYNGKGDDNELTDSEKNRKQVETDENTTDSNERQEIQSLHDKIAELQTELSMLKETKNNENVNEESEE